MPETARLIIETATREGFTGAGIAPVSETALQPLSDWLAKGYNAGMEYMGRNILLRGNPAGLLEGARSIMVFTMPYPDSITGKSGEKYAGFAIGKDYHYIIKERLSRIAGTCLPSGSRYRVFCDSAPVMERYWAEKCGLGAIGKNNFLISKASGARVLIGEILTCETFDKKTAGALRDWNDSNDRLHFNPGFCAGCGRCIEACPNGALKGRGLLDASKCISYHTVESKDRIPENMVTKGWVLGCEECLLACPFSRPPRTEQAISTEQAIRNADNDGARLCATEFYTNAGLLESLGKEDWERMDNAAFKSHFKGTAFERPGLEKLKDNINKAK